MNSDLDNKKRAEYSDEIDIRVLMRSFKKAIKSLFFRLMNLILAFRSLTRANYKLIIGFCIVGLMAGFYYLNFFNPYYESTLILRSPYFREGIESSFFEQLNKLSEEENHTQLASILNIKPHEAKMIKDISVEQVLTSNELLELETLKATMGDKLLQNDKMAAVLKRIQTQSGSTYMIKVEAYDPFIFEIIEEPIIDFIKSSNFIKKRIEINKLNLLARKDKLQSEIGKLDTLRDIVQKSIMLNDKKSMAGTNHIFLGDQQLVSPVEILNEQQKRFNEILAIEKELYIQSDFEIVNGINSFNKPNKSSFVWIIIVSLLASIALAYTIIFFVGLNKLLDKLEDKKNKVVRLNNNTSTFRETGT